MFFECIIFYLLTFIYHIDEYIVETFKVDFLDYNSGLVLKKKKIKVEENKTEENNT